ncbi:MAG: hypothetical protein ACSHXB_02235 [Sulfitobacter sp.]
MSNANFIEALEEIVKMSRSSIAFFGAPLALLLSQLRFLHSLDGFWVSALATVSALSLVVGTYLAIDSSYRGHALLAKEKLTRDGNQDGKGFLYLKWFEGVMEPAGFVTSEEAFVAHSEWLQRPVKILFFVSYGSLVLLLLIAIWTGPVK